ncbi:hypothetical protein TrVGV298_001823 [Trichoderma virens]|nr:hypothetical protein TrVGV298_001823 [Trichoderma virens]
MEANANILPNDILFATFSAANDAAILLFELIQAKASPPNLVSDGNSIGFELSLPVTSDHHDSSGSDTGSETSSDTGLGSDRLEWKIGAGASPAMVDKGLVQNNPQIVLCPPGTSPASQAVRKYIKDFHASIYVHAKSGVLMLKAICDRPMIYEQGDMHDNDLELGLAPFTALLRKMLAWDPQDRPTVTEALASDAWQLVWTEKQKDEDKKKQKRKAKMQSDGAKRVRVLSPQEQDYRVFEP